MNAKTVTTQVTLYGHYQALAFAIHHIDSISSNAMREQVLRAVAAYFGYAIMKVPNG